MHKLNKKGYMLIELILASFLAITVGLYLIELIFNFREKVQDDFYSSNIYCFCEMSIYKINMKIFLFFI